MQGNKSAKANRINITEPVYAKLLTDTADGVTYDEVRSLGKAMQVQLTPSVSSGVLYGNGVQQENIAKMNGLAMVMDVNKLAI